MIIKNTSDFTKTLNVILIYKKTDVPVCTLKTAKNKIPTKKLLKKMKQPKDKCKEVFNIKSKIQVLNSKP